MLLRAVQVWWILVSCWNLCFCHCPKFRENYNKSSVLCQKECFDEGQLWGTTVYDKDSKICLAAKHAGIIDPKGDKQRVNFKYLGRRSNFVGTVKNRVVSRSYSPSSGYSPLKRKISYPAYEFTSPKWIPKEVNEDTWLVDVFMIHDLDGRTLTCLWTDPKFDDDPNIYQWDFESVSGNQSEVKDKMMKMTTVDVDYDNSPRAFNCFGKYPFTDVSGIANNPEKDFYIADKLTYGGVLDHNLTVNFSKSSFGGKVFKRRFPDSWIYKTHSKPNECIPLKFESLKKADRGLYIIGSKGENEYFDENGIESNLSYFVMITECPIDKYGESCKKTCRNCLNGGVCHPLIGGCICQPGFHGVTCEKKCPLDHFGSKCQFNCSSKHLGKGISGGKTNCSGIVFCLPKPYGCSCSFGYEGLFCNQSTTEVTKSKGLRKDLWKTYAISLTVVVIVLFLFIIIVMGRKLYKKYILTRSLRPVEPPRELQVFLPKERSGYAHPSLPRLPHHDDDDQPVASNLPSQESEISYMNPAMMSKHVRTRIPNEDETIYQRARMDEPVQYENTSVSFTKDEMEIYLNGLINDPNLMNEFNLVPKSYGKSSICGAHPMNTNKNRYKHVVPYDETRVVLTRVNNDLYSDYINASFVNRPEGSKWYIAAQTPLKETNKNTIKDFWRMLSEVGVEVIVMIENFSESENEMGHYFDPNETLELEELSIDVIGQVQEPYFTRSVIQVSNGEQAGGVKRIIHYQFMEWPDHGVPTRLYPLVSLIQSVTRDHEKGGIIIHCSDGLKSTGTILMTLFLKDMYESFSTIDPLGILKNMRSCRAGILENVDHFNLSLSLYYEYMFGDIGLIRSSDFQTRWKSYRKKANILYERLGKQLINCSYNNGINHLNLNRNPSVLPCEPYGILFDNQGRSNDGEYLNAVSIDIIDFLGSVIVTEHPMRSTLRSFWKMIFMKRCSYVLLLNYIGESEEFPAVIPVEENVMNHGDICLKAKKLHSTYDDPGYCYSVEITSEGSSHSVTVIQITEWGTDQEVPADISLLEKIAVFILSILSNNSAPLTLCCSDGVSTCGLVTTAVHLINRINIYQEINVYNSTLRVRRHRPQFIACKKQFLALYTLAKLYLDHNPTHQTFH